MSKDCPGIFSEKRLSGSIKKQFNQGFSGFPKNRLHFGEVLLS
jgi:hypothetical protein